MDEGFSSATIAKLVLGYLKEEAKEAYNPFLNNCRHLKGVRDAKRRKQKVSTRCNRYNLTEILHQYAEVYILVQKYLEDTNYYREGGTRTLVAELTYLLERGTHNSRSSTPESCIAESIMVNTGATELHDLPGNSSSRNDDRSANLAKTDQDPLFDKMIVDLIGPEPISQENISSRSLQSDTEKANTSLNRSTLNTTFQSGGHDNRSKITIIDSAIITPKRDTETLQSLTLDARAEITADSVAEAAAPNSDVLLYDGPLDSFLPPNNPTPTEGTSVSQSSNLLAIHQQQYNIPHTGMPVNVQPQLPSYFVCLPENREVISLPNTSLPTVYLCTNSGLVVQPKDVKPACSTATQKRELRSKPQTECRHTTTKASAAYYLTNYKSNIDSTEKKPVHVPQTVMKHPAKLRKLNDAAYSDCCGSTSTPKGGSVDAKTVTLESSSAVRLITPEESIAANKVQTPRSNSHVRALDFSFVGTPPKEQAISALDQVVTKKTPRKSVKTAKMVKSLFTTPSVRSWDADLRHMAVPSTSQPIDHENRNGPPQIDLQQEQSASISELNTTQTAAMAIEAALLENGCSEKQDDYTHAEARTLSSDIPPSAIATETEVVPQTPTFSAKLRSRRQSSRYAVNVGGALRRQSSRHKATANSEAADALLELASGDPKNPTADHKCGDVTMTATVIHIPENGSDIKIDEILGNAVESQSTQINLDESDRTEEMVERKLGATCEPAQDKADVVKAESASTSLGELRKVNIKPKYYKKCNAATTTPSSLTSVSAQQAAAIITVATHTTTVSLTNQSVNKRSIIPTQSASTSSKAGPSTAMGMPSLETPIKCQPASSTAASARTSNQPKTPGHFSPANVNDTPFTKVFKEHLAGMDLTEFPTPQISLTPFLPDLSRTNTPASPFNRPTDYSTSSSYYQPSDTEENRSCEKTVIDECKRLEAKQTPVHIVCDADDEPIDEQRVENEGVQCVTQTDILSEKQQDGGDEENSSATLSYAGWRQPWDAKPPATPLDRTKLEQAIVTAIKKRPTPSIGRKNISMMRKPSIDDVSSNSDDTDGSDSSSSSDGSSSDSELQEEKKEDTKQPTTASSLSSGATIKAMISNNVGGKQQKSTLMTAAQTAAAMDRHAKVFKELEEKRLRVLASIKARDVSGSSTSEIAPKILSQVKPVSKQSTAASKRKAVVASATTAKRKKESASTADRIYLVETSDSNSSNNEVKSYEQKKEKQCRSVSKNDNKSKPAITVTTKRSPRVKKAVAKIDTSTLLNLEKTRSKSAKKSSATVSNTSKDDLGLPSTSKSKTKSNSKSISSTSRNTTKSKGSEGKLSPASASAITRQMKRDSNSKSDLVNIKTGNKNKSRKSDVDVGKAKSVVNDDKKQVETATSKDAAGWDLAEKVAVAVKQKVVEPKKSEDTAAADLKDAADQSLVGTVKQKLIELTANENGTTLNQIVVPNVSAKKTIKQNDVEPRTNKDFTTALRDITERDLEVLTKKTVAKQSRTSKDSKPTSKDVVNKNTSVNKNVSSPIKHKPIEKRINENSATLKIAVPQDVVSAKKTVAKEKMVESKTSKDTTATLKDVATKDLPENKSASTPIKQQIVAEGRIMDSKAIPKIPVRLDVSTSTTVGTPIKQHSRSTTDSTASLYDAGQNLSESKTLTKYIEQKIIDPKISEESISTLKNTDQGLSTNKLIYTTIEETRSNNVSTENLMDVADLELTTIRPKVEVTVSEDNHDVAISSVTPSSVPSPKDTSILSVTTKEIKTAIKKIEVASKQSPLKDEAAAKLVRGMKEMGFHLMPNHRNDVHHHEKVENKPQRKLDVNAITEPNKVVVYETDNCDSTSTKSVVDIVNAAKASSKSTLENDSNFERQDRQCNVSLNVTSNAIDVNSNSNDEKDDQDNLLYELAVTNTGDVEDMAVSVKTAPLGTTASASNVQEKCQKNVPLRKRKVVGVESTDMAASVCKKSRLDEMDVMHSSATDRILVKRIDVDSFLNKLHS